ncbi:hypothetical protein WDU94_004000 [Cyamophila willieti]
MKSDLKSTLTDLKQKLKNNVRIKPKVELSPVGPRPGSYLDFPRKNLTRLAIIQDEWNEYYACLKLQERVLGLDKIFNPEARLAIAGTNVKVDCNICVSPSDSGTQIKWFYSPKLTTNITDVEELNSGDDTVISTFDSTLHILNIQQKRSDASSELLVTFCKEKCQNNQIFKVTDEFGNVLETANNSAGYYSLLQDVPQVPSSVKSQTLAVEEFNSVIIICPGHSYDNMDESSPIEWQTNNKLLVPKMMSDQTNGRVEIDPMGRLTFNRLWITDSKIYSCWQNKELLGLVKLQVVRSQQHSPLYTLTNHVFTLIAIILAMTFLYVAVRVYQTKQPEY